MKKYIINYTDNNADDPAVVYSVIYGCATIELANAYIVEFKLGNPTIDMQLIEVKEIIE